jgi:hypothetical protein
MATVFGTGVIVVGGIATAQGNAPKVETRFNGVQALGRPTGAQRQEQHHEAPVPKFAAHTAPSAAPGATQGTTADAKPALSPLKPGHQAVPQGQQANRPEPPKPGQPAALHPAETQRPADNGHPPVPQAHQAEAPHVPAAPQPSHQAEAPHVAPPQAQHVEPHHAAEPPHAPAAPPQQAQVPAPHPAAPPPQAPHPAAQPAPAPHPAAPAQAKPADEKDKK